MTPKFLREEAARFRGMAETMDREASKLRLMTMADDYEAKANAADGTNDESPADMKPPEPIAAKPPRRMLREPKEPV
jgi:hypothetical protein